MTITAKKRGSQVFVQWDGGTANSLSRTGAPDIVGPMNTPFTDKHPPSRSCLRYTANLANGGPNGPSSCVSVNIESYTTSSGYMTAIGQDIPESPFGSFVLLVPLGGSIVQYIHNAGNVVEGPWRAAHRLALPPGQIVLDTSLSLIQSSTGKLHVIARAGQPIGPFGQKDGVLLGYEFPLPQWSSPITLQAENGPISQVIGSQALIQSFRDGVDQFELLVPTPTGIVHYIHSVGSVIDGPWKRVAEIQLPAGLPGLNEHVAVVLLQNVFKELIAIVSFDGMLRAYVLEGGNTWSGPFAVDSDQGPIVGVTGTPAFIQHDEDAFDLVVSTITGIFHYRLEKQPVQQGGVWQLIARLDPPENNGFLQTPSFTPTLNEEGDLELVARASHPFGLGEDFMVGYVFDQANQSWRNAVDLLDENGRKLIASNDLQHSGDDDIPRGAQSNQHPGSLDTGQPSIS